MRTNGKEPVVLLALNFETEEQDVQALLDCGVPRNAIQPGRGYYNNKKELCYAVSIEHFTPHVKALLTACHQESVLFLDNQYNAWLSQASKDYAGYSEPNADKRPTFIGEFKQISVTQAAQKQAWTEFGGKYYYAG
ncbi:hypothetical protein Kaagvere_00007 [Pseudomonas phage vB_PpuP-Kaagvere]